jgi:GxxExxY protein
VCARALAVTLQELGLSVQEEVYLPVVYRGQRVGQFKVDLIVNDVIVVEIKAQQQLERYHHAQVLHYLRASERSVGLLLNFGPEPVFKRIVFDHARTRHRRSLAVPPLEKGSTATTEMPRSDATPEAGDLA